MKNIVILISGAGSNMAAIVKTAKNEDWSNKLGASVVAVISTEADSPGLAFAHKQGIDTAVVKPKSYATRQDFDQALMQKIETYRPTLVVLAGFMRILTPAFVNHYADRLINIHPSLLPAFTGLNTHQRAIDAGCKFAGATVHRVTAELDVGPILAQVVVPILQNDTALSLAIKVKSQEHVMYPKLIEQLLK